MKKTLNEGLKRRQEKLRQETINIVETAIKDLQNEGYTIIKISTLKERTGLGRSTFDKPHVVNVLKKNKVDRFGSRTVIDSKREELIIRELEKENKKYQREIAKLNNQLKNKEERIKKLEQQLEEKDLESQVVRGEIMNVMRKARIKGIDLQD